MKNSVRYSALLVLLVLGIGLCAFASKNKAQKVSYTDGKYTVHCEKRNGLYDGKYVSYYPNKKKKAEGTFAENQRTGKWTVWDSTGKKITERIYQNNFEFTRTYPAYPDGPAKLFSAAVYQLNYNSKGYIEYYFLQERAVAVSKRIWRYIPQEKNPLLFQFNRFLSMVFDSVKAGKAGAWDKADDEFRKKLLPDALNQYADTSSYALLGYKIKEDWFYDLDREISETRIIGLMPVMRDKRNNDTVEIAWFYYPQLRAIAASQQHECNAVNQNQSTLDNVFFFRNFYGEIYKESNLYDRALKEYAKGFMIDQERLRIEMSLIELEHDQWLRLTPKQ